MMTKFELNKIATKFDLELALIQAITAVESNGDGFIGKLPKILFERHIFYNLLKTAGYNVDAIMVENPNICNPETGGYVGGGEEYLRLNKAKEINECIAIESASWGLFQIMGFHWQLMKYDSPQQYEFEMCKNQVNHIDAFCRFISADTNKTMLTALRNKNFSRFARLYNGRDYAKNQYDIKLSTAYEHFTKNF